MSIIIFLGLLHCQGKQLKKIAKACPDENYPSAMSRILTEAKFEKELFEERYLKKIRFMFGDLDIYLLLDDTLVERNGECVEETQIRF